MSAFLHVCLGGALGSGARYLVSLWALRTLPIGFAWGTFLVNAIGSLVLGFVVQYALDTNALSPNARLFLTTGCMGGFTTYSTFNQETIALVQQGAHGLALVNVLATVAICLAAGFAGVSLARIVAGG